MTIKTLTQAERMRITINSTQKQELNEVIKDRSEMNREIEIDLAGPEGNAFVLMGKAKSLAEQLGLDGDAIVDEMKESDYENLVNVFDKYFGKHVTLYR